jgi:hypothetical protein
METPSLSLRLVDNLPTISYHYREPTSGQKVRCYNDVQKEQRTQRKGKYSTFFPPVDEQLPHLVHLF